jgi:hypothetical protein
MQTIDHTPVSRDDVEFPKKSNVTNQPSCAKKRSSLIRHHTAAINALRPRIPQHASSALKPIRYRSSFARIHHAILLIQAYIHLPATIFFDYNVLYIVVQIAFYPDQGQNSSTAWWIASGIYGACFLIWLIVVVAIWEILFNYKRRWVSEQPYAMPIYCSSSAFILTATRSFSLYSLLYRTRLGASRTDFLIESCWFYSQNWPTLLTLLPRAIILAILLALYNPTSASARPTLSQQVGSIRDPVYFNVDTGLLTDFAYIISLVYAGWIIWRFVVLLTSWLGLAILLGPRSAFQRERKSYVVDDDDDSEIEAAYSPEIRQIPAPSVQSHRPMPTIPSSQEIEIGADQNGKRRSVRMSSVTIAESERDAVRAQLVGASAPLRTRPASVDIPRRSQSLGKTGSTSKRSKSDALASSRQDGKTPSVIRSTTSEQRKHASLQASTVAVDDAPWAWRSRAEERVRLLLNQCQNAVATEEESFEWVEIPQRNATSSQPIVSHARNDGTSTLDIHERHRRSLRDSGRGIAALQLAEESLEHEGQDDQRSVDEPTEVPARASNETRSMTERGRRMSTSSELARNRSSLDSAAPRTSQDRRNELNGTPAFISQAGDEEFRYHDRDDGDDDEEEDAHSDSTEDSEERRIWSAFPEQSRRHPPGLIAVKMQHKQLEHRRRSNEEERRERESNLASASTNSASTVSAVPIPIIAATTGSPPMASDATIEEQAMQGSNASLQLPVSPSEGLLPIQEESWSSSSSTTDEDQRFVHSYLPHATG